MLRLDAGPFVRSGMPPGGAVWPELAFLSACNLATGFRPAHAELLAVQTTGRYIFIDKTHSSEMLFHIRGEVVDHVSANFLF